jgi:hypothetical protein
MAASRAGWRTRENISMKSVRKKRAVSESTKTRPSTSTPRAKSDTYMTLRLSNRSATTPDTAPKRTAGRNRPRSGTATPDVPPKALPRASVAKRLTQSPREETSPANHSRANWPLRTSWRVVRGVPIESMRR